MQPIITIIGRPNVGKSTLFNVLTKSKDALVADIPGVTRDRQFGEGTYDGKDFMVIDTGGIEEPDDPQMGELTSQQVDEAIEEGNIILFLVDNKSGLATGDEAIAKRLRPHKDKVHVIINKVDHEEAAMVTGDFYRLGLGDPTIISAKRKRNIKQLLADLLLPFEALEKEAEDDSIKIAIIGRPNVGKSTLTNRMLGEERVIVCDRPGTTRDSIAIKFTHHDQAYTLIDTAGVRRRTKVTEVIEKFSIIKTLQALAKCEIAIMVFNARESITDQDLRLLRFILERGKGLVLAFNQWDDMSEEDRNHLKEEVDRRLPFVEFARRYFISAKHGTGVGKLYHAINEAYESACRDIPTPELTRELEKATKVHQPPLVKGRRIKLRYAHLGGHHPLIIIIHGKQVDSLPGSYKTFLANYFRKTYKLIGVPLILHFKNDVNPYSTK